MSDGRFHVKRRPAASLLGVFQDLQRVWEPVELAYAVFLFRATKNVTRNKPSEIQVKAAGSGTA